MSAPELIREMTALTALRGKRPENFETYYRGVRDTGLSMLFERFRYRDTSTLWPRVAIIIEERPELHGNIANEFFENSKTETDYCWRFRAKVWGGPARSEDIAPFNWCFSETRFTPYAKVPIWAGRCRGTWL